MLIKNLNIGIKLFILGGIAFTMSIVIAVIGIFNIRSLVQTSNYTYNYITLPLEYSGKAIGDFNLMRVYLYKLATSTTFTTNQEFRDGALEAYDSFKNTITLYHELIVNYENADLGEVNDISSIYNTLDRIKELIDSVIELGMINRRDSAVRLLNYDLNDLYIDYLEPQLIHLSALNVDQSEEAAINAAKDGEETLILSGIILVVALLIMLTLLIFITKAITTPIKEMVQVADSLARGQLNVNVKYSSRDEIGVLGDKLKIVINTLRTLIDDMSVMAKEHNEKGDIDYKVPSEKFEGAYKEVIDGTNVMINMYVEDVKSLLVALDGFGKGDFGAEIQEMPGKKKLLNDVAENLRKNLLDISTEINIIVKAATEGKLDKTIDSSKYNGDWAKIMNRLNELSNAISIPISEALNVLEQVEHGKLHTIMHGEYRGDFLRLKNYINRTITQLSDIITDISEKLISLSSDNYDINITKDYPNDFAPIKEGMGKIIDRINLVMADINSSADQVASGAREISKSSVNLSQGAAKQASTTEELNSTVIMIAEKTRSSAETAIRANELAVTAKENAISGNSDMKHMLGAMDEINTSSNEISKIIKTIEEIALQTDLLALNAAVEAAHAGSLGKGFTVVADQVRALALRSKEAAKQTTELIQGTIDKVDQGMHIATQTANSLELIVSDITSISGFVDEIATSASEQAENIDQIKIGISEISDVTQTNTATSQEEAASAEQLSSQAEIFRSMVNKFKLRK